MSEYSNLEWTQIGIFLIGLPVAALVGSLVGLVGKWKQGQVVTAVIFGLGSAAAVSIVALAGFIIAVVIGTSTNGVSWVHVFDWYVSRRMTTLAVSVAWMAALLFAIFLRRRSTQHSLASLSLRQLLLIQLFAFVVLGSWIGMRSYALSQGAVLEKASHKWSKRGWVVNGSVPVGKAILEYAYPQPSVDWKNEGQTLREVCKEPWLGGLKLSHLDNADELDFGAIATAKNLDFLMLRYNPVTMPPQSHIDTIAKASSLSELHIHGGDLSLADLTPLLKLKALKKVELREVTCDGVALRDAIRKLNLDHFRCIDHNPRGRRSVGVAYWQSYLSLHNHQGEIDVDDLRWVDPSRLKILDVNGSELTLAAAKEISQMPNLYRIDLNCRVEGPALAEIAKCANLQHAFIRGLAPPQDRSAFDLSVNELVMAPKLKVIDWMWRISKPDLDVPPFTEAELRLQMQGQPQPTLFNRMPTTAQTSFVEEINRKRAELKLGKLTINPNDPMRPQLLSAPPEAP